MTSFSLSEPAVQSYMLYSGVLAVKVLGVSVLTGIQRTRKKVYANEEDAKFKNGTVRYDDPDVERVRRAHLNDLENIPAFWALGALYLTIGPSAGCATNLFRVYAAGRVLYTIVYAVKPVPAVRGIAFGVPFLITAYMGVKVIQHYCAAW